MADGTFKLMVFSGKGLELETEAAMVTVPSALGEIGFLPNHCDFIGLLDTGKVTYQASEKSGAGATFDVEGGICTFANNTLRLLADSVQIPG
jgi:F-type H+-transporting ATPase subunit epsilon